MHMRTKKYVSILERDDGTPATLAFDVTIRMTDSLYCI
jgi:hypothetical protein